MTNVNSKPKLKPKISKWMDQANLKLADTITEFGRIASPTLENINFDLQEYDAETIAKTLNHIYNTDISPSIWNRASISNKTTLEKLAMHPLAIEKLQTVLPHDINYMYIDSNLYICGIGIPEINFLYIEYNYPDRAIKDNYKPMDYRPNIFHTWDAIPLLKKEEPKIKK